MGITHKCNVEFIMNVRLNQSRLLEVIEVFKLIEVVE